MTKVEKAQMEREKNERERMAQMTSKSGSAYNLIPGANPPFSAGLVVDA